MTVVENHARPLVGIAYVVAAVFLFALADVLTKYLAMRNSVPLVMAVRYCASLIMVLFLIWPRIGSRL